jgi:predicted MFS family arabinose efflux permease
MYALTHSVRHDNLTLLCSLFGLGAGLGGPLGGFLNDALGWYDHLFATRSFLSF